MPKPNKGEAKQDFLQRCTKDLMSGENKEADQAYAMCNRYWDDAKSQRAVLQLAAPLTLQAVDGVNSQGFLITAFTGAIIDNFWGRLMISIDGIIVNAKMPALREHARDRVVGYSTKAWQDGSNLLLQGTFSTKTRDGQEVRDLLAEGFPWQASIGVWPKKIKILDSDKESEMVNGQKIIGPVEIWLESYVREVSFCALGADDQTAAISLAEDQKKVPVRIERAGPKNKEEAMPMTLEQLEAEAPALLKGIRDQARSEITLAVLLAQQPAEGDRLRAEGEARERARVVEILEYEGDPAVTLEAIKAGQSFAEMVKLSRQAEKTGRSKALKEMQKGAPAPLGQVPVGGSGETFEAKVQQRVEGQKLSRAAAIKQVAREFPDLHEAYIARQNQGK